MDWKIIGIGALISTALSVVISYIMFPLIFLGPLTGDS